MSLRQVFRSKLKSLESKSEKDRKGNESTNSSKSQLSEDVGAQEVDEMVNLEDPPPGTSADLSEHDLCSEHEEYKAIYELQLTQLQEQLVAAMIENQNLGLELKSFKEENKIDKLVQDLEYEKQRNVQLVSEIQTTGKPKGGPKDGSQVDKEARDWVDIAQEATEELDHCLPPEEKIVQHLTIKAWLVRTFYELMADFTDEAEPEDQDESEGEQLAVKKLKDNMKRFKQGTKPIYNTAKGVQAMLIWRQPATTLIIFGIYMYSVWHGWLLPVTLFLAIFRLFANYLRYRGWNINIRYFNEIEAETTEPEHSKESSMSDKFNLVLQVARQVQNQLGKIADSLEKVKNLLMWKQPDATLRLFLFLIVAFVLSCVLPGTTFFLFVGLWMGFKMFILEYIYSRFPKFKQRHDSVHQMWKDLPTDTDLLKRYQKAAIDRQVLTSDHPPPQRSQSEGLRADEKHFCEIFNLPYSEKPRPGWEAGRRCTLIDRDKAWTSGFKSGKLYLTMSFLCFERYKTVSPKNILMPLTDITRIQKVKPYTWLPGAGMSIEVTIVGYDKPYLFGALLSRDECYENLFAHGTKHKLPWAADPETASLTDTPGTSGEDNKPETTKDKSPTPEPSFRMSELTDDMNNYFLDAEANDQGRVEQCEDVVSEFDFPGDISQLEYLAS